MTDKTLGKRQVLNLPSTSVGAHHPRRSGAETVEFSVKGPISISLDEEDVASPGCSVLDLQFPGPSQVGEVLFRNYYTAWLTVLTRIDASNGRPSIGSSHGKLFIPPASKGISSSTKTTEQVGGWVVSVPRKNLMPNPHLETGSHDLISISASESEVEWKNVLTIRLVLRQPSPIWRTFHVEEINVYHDLPRRIPRSIQNSYSVAEPVSCQPYDSLLSQICHQTMTALHWVPEPKDSVSIKDNTGPCGYEFFNLPQI